ncbi:MAG: hypothetical protein AAGC55_19170, partial [Myxococcota bacterium]
MGQAQASELLIDIDTAGCHTNLAINNAIGQSFKVPERTTLDRIEIWIKPELYYTTSYNVELYQGQGTSGAVLATSNTVTLNSQTDGVPSTWRGFSFAGQGIVLQPNQSYTFRLVRLSTYSGAFSRCDNVYADGQMYWLGYHPEWNRDMSFRLYGISNLLENGDGSAGDMSGWTITANGGAGWSVQGGTFRTSHNWARRTQLVDLHAKGFDAAAMASAPPILISERFRKTYCPDSYYLKVELLDGNMNVVDTFDTGTVQQTGGCAWNGDWETVSHVFTAYGPNVRYVRWEDGGDDSENWAGHYGPKLDDAMLRVGDNLLDNPAADNNDMVGWTITANGGAGWKASGGQFHTSYDWARRTQLVDLYAYGHNASSMATEPAIHVSERFRRTYCPDF